MVKSLEIGDDAEEVITNCVTGFDQGIPKHKLGSRKWFTPDIWTLHAQGSVPEVGLLPIEPDG